MVGNYIYIIYFVNLISFFISVCNLNPYRFSQLDSVLTDILDNKGAISWYSIFNSTKMLHLLTPILLGISIVNEKLTERVKLVRLQFPKYPTI